MKLSVLGTLVVAIPVIHAGRAIQCKKVEVSDLTTGELFAARAKAVEGEFWSMHEIAAKTQLIDNEGQKYQMTYEMVRDTSSANFKRLEELDLEVQLKLNAESIENPSS